MNELVELLKTDTEAVMGVIGAAVTAFGGWVIWCAGRWYQRRVETAKTEQAEAEAERARIETKRSQMDYIEDLEGRLGVVEKRNRNLGERVEELEEQNKRLMEAFAVERAALWDQIKDLQARLNNCEERTKAPVAQ